MLGLKSREGKHRADEPAFDVPPELQSDPYYSLQALAEARFGRNQEGKPTWFMVKKVAGVSIKGMAVTDGNEYFSLPPETETVREHEVAPNGSYFGHIDTTRISDNPKIVRVNRVVDWMND